MTDHERKTIHIPEVCRVEGHSAVHVDIDAGKVSSVTLDVFEGTRFFEKIVLGHHYEEIPHITSRVCAICSTGHVLAAIFAVEQALGIAPSSTTLLLRELLHLGMLIESHATHIYALALPDYVGAPDLSDLASRYPDQFENWNQLRNLGAAIQTIIGGRPFHPVNMHVGGLSRFPAHSDLKKLLAMLSSSLELAFSTCDLLLSFKPPVARTTQPVFLALVPRETEYGFFGNTVRSSEGWEEPVQNYKQYLGEHSVPYSHAKQSTARGKPLMVGSMARLSLFGHRLGRHARSVYTASPLASGDMNSLWNNLAQAIEIVECIYQAELVIEKLLVELPRGGGDTGLKRLPPKAGQGAGAVECPRGTLYHCYSLDDRGHIAAADMITPSAQNTARIELDIREVVTQFVDKEPETLQANLETLVRAYDPCNTCATHMVSVKYN